MFVIPGWPGRLEMDERWQVIPVPEYQINSQILILRTLFIINSSVSLCVSLDGSQGRDHKFLDKTICYQILILIRVGFYWW